MKLHVLSDLHLECSNFEPPLTDADVIVLAGDVWKAELGIHWARSAFPGKEIVYVAGNHEFYGVRRLEAAALMKIAAREFGVHLLDDEARVLGGVRFLGCTLWTDFLLFGEQERPYAMREGQQTLSDFHVIRENSQEPFSPSRSIDLHTRSLSWLTQKLDEPFDGKTVVVTHHLPSMLSCAYRFRKNLLSACFASNLDGLFGKMDLWVHGHTHDSFDYESNDTRVICNPRGYVTYSYQENFDFDPGLVIEI